MIFLLRKMMIIIIKDRKKRCNRYSTLERNSRRGVKRKRTLSPLLIVHQISDGGEKKKAKGKVKRREKKRKEKEGKKEGRRGSQRIGNIAPDHERRTHEGRELPCWCRDP